MDICIVGAGLSGLAVLRRLRDKPQINKIVAFEKSSVIGGQWAYTDKTGVHQSSYKDLFANDPVDTTRFLDYPHKKEHIPGSFVKISDMWQYLKDFADDFDLHKYIQLNSSVTRVEPVEKETALRWKVTVEEGGQTNTHNFHAVFVCSGHETVPLVHEVPRLEDFTGHVLHSHDFRNPDRYRGQVVLCVGSGSSSADIGGIVASEAKLVYHSHRGNPYFNKDTIYAHNVKPVPKVKKFKERSVILADDSEIEIDSVVLCTGYKYDFPFLTDHCQPMTPEDEKIQALSRLYKGMIHVDYPRLYFIGLLKTIPSFMVNDLQAQFAVADLLGHTKLPDRATMVKDIQEDYQDKVHKGVPVTRIPACIPLQYFLVRLQNSFLEMADAGVITPIPRDRMEFFDHVVATICYRPNNFRSRRYPLGMDWSEVPHPEIPTFSTG